MRIESTSLLGSIIVKFQYEPNGKSNKKTGPCYNTKCIITHRFDQDGQMRDIVFSGVAKQDSRDKFCKQRGRKIAMRIAMDGFTSYLVNFFNGAGMDTDACTKRVRSEIWRAYFDNHRDREA